MAPEPAPPHVPAWLEDVVAHLATKHEAEAVFLVAPPAGGQSTPSVEQRLVVLVDNEEAPGRGLSPIYRWETLDGFAGPVKYLRATLAELMAGAYGGGSPWGDLIIAAWPLHDPLDYQRRVAAQRSSMQTPAPAVALEAARKGATEARQLAEAGGEAVAHLLAIRAADELASWLARREGAVAMDASAVAAAVAQLSRGVARAFAELLEAPSAMERVDALDRFIEAVDATLRLQDARN